MFYITIVNCCYISTLTCVTAWLYSRNKIEGDAGQILKETNVYLTKESNVQQMFNTKGTKPRWDVNVSAISGEGACMHVGKVWCSGCCMLNKQKHNALWRGRERDSAQRRGFIGAGAPGPGSPTQVISLTPPSR